MSLSLQSEKNIDELSKMADELTVSLKERHRSEPGVDDAIVVIARYVALLASGQRISSPQEALKGANGLTTVVKGLNDLMSTASDQSITFHSVNLANTAIKTAAQLRSELNFPT